MTTDSHDTVEMPRPHAVPPAAFIAVFEREAARQWFEANPATVLRPDEPPRWATGLAAVRPENLPRDLAEGLERLGVEPADYARDLRASLEPDEGAGA